jgi:hypothetical protein
MQTVLRVHITPKVEFDAYQLTFLFEKFGKQIKKNKIIHNNDFKKTIWKITPKNERQAHADSNEKELNG